jgi:uncharacterized phiE125 gp8 family phage protein
MKNLQVKIATDLKVEPVTVDEAKLFCKVTGGEEDALFQTLIKAARRSLERYTASSFGKKTIHAFWMVPPDDNQLELPYGPIISVDAVYRIDEEQAEEACTLNEDYYVYGYQDAVVYIEKYWSSGMVSARSIRVEYTAGYDNTETEVLPDELRLAILKQVATDYELRENIAVGTIQAVLSNDSKSLAAPYRKKLWF